MKTLLKKIKSDKGFTMQDLVIAIIILTLFAGTIGGTYLTIYKIQSETKLNTIASLYAIQILENIDKISYDDVINGMEEQYRNSYNIPSSMNLEVKVSKYNEEDTLKKIELSISYEFSGDKETLLLERLKVKEL